MISIAVVVIVMMLFWFIITDIDSSIKIGMFIRCIFTSGTACSISFIIIVINTTGNVII